mmetsp:Transcript_403/g.943  ORF Transcript_403/g.943 Transcript_403/m.943 type:complete len:91 (+) Transcript_403:246-518(+)
MAFATTGAVVAGERRGAAAAACARRSRAAAGRLRMASSEPEKKKESIMDWLNKKMMHNWQDDAYGYEPYMKDVNDGKTKEVTQSSDTPSQ